jgi:uroporphyrinogen-III synthase
LEKPAIVIFSSPSTVKCFSRVEDFKEIVPIAIGKKTKKALLGYFKEEEILMPSKPSIKKCIELARSL